MGQLDEADAQYQKALALDATTAYKAEAQLVGLVRSNLQEAKRCLKEGDSRCNIIACLLFFHKVYMQQLIANVAILQMLHQVSWCHQSCSVPFW